MFNIVKTYYLFTQYVNNVRNNFHRIWENGIIEGRLVLEEGEEFGDSELWVLREPITYFDAEYGSITVLPGMRTDGASIPKFLWAITGPPLRDSRTARPAVVHDLLYYLSDKTRFSRLDSDIIFARALNSRGVSKVKVLSYYIGVRLGGWVGWNRYKNQEDSRQVAFQETALTWFKDYV